MRILVIGGTGTIGRAVVQLLEAEHELVIAGRRGPEPVDITDPTSLRALFARVGEVDAIVVAAGGAAWKPFAELDDADYARSLQDKLMGQVNAVRYGLPFVRDGGSITITSGVLAQHPMNGSAAMSLVNSAIEGFGRAAAHEAPRDVRINVVSPDWVTETLASMGQDPRAGVTPQKVASVYADVVTGSDRGLVLPAVP